MSKHLINSDQPIRINRNAMQDKRQASPKKVKHKILNPNPKWPIANLTLSKPEIAKQCIERYLDGETIDQQAQQIGVSRQRLSKVILETAPDEWRGAQAAYAWGQYEDAKAELGRAADTVDVARAREKLATARWELERMSRRLFGQDQPPAQAQVVFNLSFGSKSVKTIEHGADEEVVNPSNIK